EQSGAVRTGRELEVAYDGGTSAEGGNDAAPVPSAAAGRVKRIFARDDVVMTKGTDRVTSSAAEFDTIGEISVLTGRVEFTSGPDRQAVADRAILDFKSDTALLIGAVTVSQGPNSLQGRHLFV